MYYDLSNFPAGYDLYSLVGGLDKTHICPVDYRTELREAKARVDLPFYRAILDEFGFSLDLMLHAIESQLRETGNGFIFYLCIYIYYIIKLNSGSYSARFCGSSPLLLYKLF